MYYGGHKVELLQLSWGITVAGLNLKQYPFHITFFIIIMALSRIFFFLVENLKQQFLLKVKKNPSCFGGEYLLYLFCCDVLAMKSTRPLHFGQGRVLSLAFLEGKNLGSSCAFA